MQYLETHEVNELNVAGPEVEGSQSHLPIYVDELFFFPS